MAVSPAQRVIQLYGQGVRGDELTRRIQSERGLSRSDATTAVARARATGNLGAHKPLDQDRNAARKTLQQARNPRAYAGQLHNWGYRGTRLRSALRAAGLSQNDATTAIVRARDDGLLPSGAYPGTQLPTGNRNDGGSSPGGGRSPRASEPTPAPSPTPAPQPQPQEPNTELLAELDQLFPWASDIGLGPQWFRDVAVEATTPQEIVVQLRQTEQYKKRFPAITRSDGSRRMTEAEYIATEDAFRGLFRDFGFDEEAYDTPAKLKSLFESEQDPNELQDRLETHQAIRDSSQGVRDAFYVYAGLDVSNDDLFEAVLDPATANRLRGMYREAVSSGQLDYDTFLDRVGEVATKRAANLAASVESEEQFNQKIGNKQFQKQLLDVLFTGGKGEITTEPLALQELLAAYEEATIGATAVAAGFELPDLNRIAEIRAAGITKARAQEQYLRFGIRARSLSANAQRAGRGPLGREEFEDAAFFGEVDAARAISSAEAYGSAVGQSSGSFRFTQDRRGRLAQPGLRDF